MCLLVGVAEAGKTHTKHLLFRWAPPESRNSIPLAARPLQAIRVRMNAQGGQLQKVDPDQLDKILADTVAKRGVCLEKRFIQQLQQRICCKWNTETTSIGLSTLPPKDNTTSARISVTHMVALQAYQANLPLVQKSFVAAFQLHISLLLILSKPQRQY